VPTRNSPHAPIKKRHVYMQHAKKPHGIALIALVLFVVAWTSWTFVVW
jgi:hypothetical protein